MLLSFGLTKLHVGSATGLEDYVFTAGNKVVPQGTVDAGKYYDLVVTDSNGVQRSIVPRTAASNFATTDNSYTIQSTDPASTATYWKYTLREFADPTTTTILKSASKTFDVAKATIYSDAATTHLQSSLGANATAYVTVTGLQPGKTDWSTTWYLPNGTTVAAANTGGSDRPDTTSTGVLAAGSFLQYDPRPTPNTGTDQWNWQSNYETKGSPNFQPLSSTNQGTWTLKLLKDNTHFVTLTAFTVDTTSRWRRWSSARRPP